MLHNPFLISPSADFWSQAAGKLTEQPVAAATRGELPDWSCLRVVVPTFAHAQQLKAALALRVGTAFIPPRITTLSAWLALMPPASTPRPSAETERLMSLYAGLRQHGWLKKMFVARRNTDLLPLAQMLLTLSDELTASLLPAVQGAPDAAEDRWHAALEKLSPKARTLLSDESQLVWSIWKSQLDSGDACVARYRQLMQLATEASAPLIWISPVEPNAIEHAFLNAYAEHQPVTPIMLDWRAASIPPTFAASWPELLVDEIEQAPSAQLYDGSTVQGPANLSGLSLYAATSLEDEAAHAAQTIVDWLAAGKSRIAVIAQDRVAARRVRALLDRARLIVTDETGWKLSTTRAAAAVAAWLELVATRGDTANLLDFLKSPFVLADSPDKAHCVLQIELALRSANVQGGWDAAGSALAPFPQAQTLLLQVAGQAAFFGGRKTLCEWIAATRGVLTALDMRAALDADAAGTQVIALLDAVARDCAGVDVAFSFPEWRAFLNLQMEATSFLLPSHDNRVVMLPLNGARLRSFDAVLLIGADADHLPSQQAETLFFANAVRHELGLATRESRQCQQLRDFTELLMANDEVVLSWQAHKDGEPNLVSPWIARLQLTLESSGAEPISMHHAAIAVSQLHALPQSRPQPAAPTLLPAKLSASGYNSLVACPYQFFAARMLRLSELGEISDLPEKRDYGDWLHQILKVYHDAVRDQKTGVEQRLPLLAQISQDIFDDVLERNPAALGYFARWQKVLPAYIDWANQREAQGWQFEVGERWAERTLDWDGGSIILHGRIDRIDRDGEGQYAVLDYKTTDAATLRKRLRDKEDHQLPFYGLLADVPVATASFVALDATKGKTGDAEAPAFQDWQQAVQTQMTTSMQAIAGGAALPASGIESVCQYCAVRGLCRKGGWS